MGVSLEVVFALIHLVINENLTLHSNHRDIPIGYKPLHVLHSTKTEIVKFEDWFATERYLLNNCFMYV